MSEKINRVVTIILIGLAEKCKKKALWRHRQGCKRTDAFLLAVNDCRIPPQTRCGQPSMKLQRMPAQVADPMTPEELQAMAVIKR